MRSSILQNIAAFSSVAQDEIKVSKLSLQPRLKGWAWEPDVPRIQPVRLTLTYRTDVSRAGASDDLRDSISYATVSNRIVELAGSGTWGDLWELAHRIAGLALEAEGTTGTEEVTVRLEHPRSLLGAESAGLEIVRSKEKDPAKDDIVFVQDLKLDTIIGVNPGERVTEQPVVLNLECKFAPNTKKGLWADDVRSLVHVTRQVCP
jgi:FolB domain-containing protein